jgi:hypothetical protein
MQIPDGVNRIVEDYRLWSDPPALHQALKLGARGCDDSITLAKINKAAVKTIQVMLRAKFLEHRDTRIDRAAGDFVYRFTGEQDELIVDYLKITSNIILM